MIEYLRFRIRIWKLFRSREKVLREFSNYKTEARNTKDKRVSMEDILFEERTETGIIDGKIETLTTEYFMKMARIGFLEIPDFSDATLWVESSFDPSRKVLSNKAIDLLRKKIRENRLFWIDQIVKIITVSTGLAGVVIGLLSIIFKK